MGSLRSGLIYLIAINSRSDTPLGFIICTHPEVDRRKALFTIYAILMLTGMNSPQLRHNIAGDSVVRLPASCGAEM